MLFYVPCRKHSWDLWQNVLTFVSSPQPNRGSHPFQQGFWLLEVLPLNNFTIYETTNCYAASWTLQELDSGSHDNKYTWWSPRLALIWQSSFYQEYIWPTRCVPLSEIHKNESGSTFQFSHSHTQTHTFSRDIWKAGVNGTCSLLIQLLQQQQLWKNTSNNSYHVISF